MLEEGLTFIDEAERLRLQATVDRHRQEQRRNHSREHTQGLAERGRPTRTPARAGAPA